MTSNYREFDDFASKMSDLVNSLLSYGYFVAVLDQAWGSKIMY